MASCSRELHQLIACACMFHGCFLSFLVLNFTKCHFVQLQNRADRETKAVLLMFLFILFEQSLWYMSPKMDEQS